jgi:hypothetical protein
MATPPWLSPDVELDEFGNPIVAPRLPFDPGPTPIPSVPPDPANSGLNSLPIGQAVVPPWQPAPPPQEELQFEPEVIERTPEAQQPPWFHQLVNVPGQPDTSQVPPWLGAAIGAGQQVGENINKHGGQYVNPPTGIARIPSLQEQEFKNISEAGQLNVEKAEKRSAMLDAAVSEQNRMMVQNEQNRQRRAQHLAAINEQRMQEADDYANGNINPDRWRERNGFLGNLAYGVAAFFSGMANPRGPNQVVEWVNREIDRDLDAQRLDMQRKGQALNMKDNLYAEMMRQYGDENLAEAAFRANKLALAGAQMSAMEAGYAPQEEKLKAQQAIIETEKARRGAEAEFQMRLAELDDKQFKMYMEQANKENDQLLRKYDIDKGAAVTMRGQDISAETTRRGQDIQKETEGGKVERQLDSEDRARAVFGPDPGGSGKNVVVGFVANPEDRAHVREVTSAHRQFMTYAKKYQTLKEKAGRLGLDKNESAELNQAYKSMVALWNGKMHLGAFDKGTETLAKGALPEPQSWWSPSDYFGNTDSAVAQSIELGTTAMDEFMDSYGFQGADPSLRYSDYFHTGPETDEGAYIDVPEQTKAVSPKAGSALPAPKLGK